MDDDFDAAHAVTKGHFCLARDWIDVESLEWLRPHWTVDCCAHEMGKRLSSIIISKNLVR